MQVRQQQTDHAPAGVATVSGPAASRGIVVGEQPRDLVRRKLLLERQPILRRFEAFTGKRARLAETGATFEDVAEARAVNGGKVHPYALDLLRQLNYDTSSLRSKSWEEFTAPGAPELDFVFTVCDNAANEVCPVCRARRSGGACDV